MRVRMGDGLLPPAHLASWGLLVIQFDKVAWGLVKLDMATWDSVG